MLVDLHIKDVVTIEMLTFSCDAGFSALTGETGAGKSIILDALGLALGQRGDVKLIRQGAEYASVTASFTLSNANHIKQCQEILEAQSMIFDHTLILRRVLQRDGKNKVFLNDQPISLSLLKTIGDHLVEIHGQFETHHLLDPKMHRILLDRYAGLEEDVSAIKSAWDVWQQKKKIMATTKQEIERALQERDYYQSMIDELRQLNPQPDEEQQLVDQRSMMMHAEKIIQALNEASEALMLDQGGRQRVHSALRSIERIQDKVPNETKNLIEGLNRAAIEIDEAVEVLDALARQLVYDRDAQAKTDERLFALRGAARKYQVQVIELPDLLQRTEKLVSSLEQQNDLIEALEKEVVQAEKSYDILATKLSVKRKNASAKLAKEIMIELPPLKLDKAQFAVTLTDKTPAADGKDHIIFEVSMNPGMPMSPLNKVASGGEMARLMLAMKLITQKSDATPTIIFDEIDTGVSGAVAEAIGLRLRRLGKTGDSTQVFAVTHAPQVAAKAHTHYKILKEADKKKTWTMVNRLNEDERIDEIARLSSGAVITDAARDAARHLIGILDKEPKKKKKA